MSLFRPAAIVLALLACVTLLLSTSCAEPAPATSPMSLRLIDHFAEARVEGSPEPLDAAAGGAKWSFADDGAEAWKLGQDVEGLRLDGGLLVGRASSEMPLVHAERQGPIAEDLLHEVEVRARASDGGNLARSAERRAGTACRSPWSPHPSKNNP